MCSYFGGKQRIGKKIAQIIHENTSTDIIGYCEPFAGMLSVYKHIPNLLGDIEYKAGDINESVIEMWKECQKGWIPPTSCTEDMYNDIKYKKPSSLRGYIGHQYSFGGAFFNGYAPKYGKNEDSTKASKNVVNNSNLTKNVKFSVGDYTQFSHLIGYVIYLDPPYFNTTQKYYDNNYPTQTKKILEDNFFKWCLMMGKKNIIFMSGYDTPHYFKEVFSSTHKLTGLPPSGFVKNKKTRVEKLFLLQIQLKHLDS